MQSERKTSMARVGSIASVFAGALLAAVLRSPAPALADDPEDGAETEHAHDLTDVWAIARGGLIYDKWWAVLELDAPGGTHPAYPAAGKKKGSSTWRCKECHGWDYKGEDGACAKGSHYSVTTGVGGVAGTDPEAIHKIIMNDTHGFTERTMPHSAMEKLALFLSRGQIDTNRSIDRATKVARGNVRRGAAFYQTICAVCHGFDGRAMNFKDEKKPECIGTVAQKNPWETLHKIRFGQPGVGMIALGVLDIQD